ncbi:MAG: hypothetical protein M3268_01165 [Acidobacteriota bacterium]|nr:hypothetical protein [Acidobacteriota bacterium]
MMRSCVRLACALALALTAFGAARADILVKKTTTYGRPAAQGQSGGESAGSGAGGQMSFTDTEMIKGRRERTERTVQIPVGKTSVPMKQVSVTQCDLKRRIDIGDATHKYYVEPIGGVDETDAGGAGEAAPAGGGRVTRGGVVTYTRAVTDTGERRQMFGFTARHLKTHTTMQPSPDACQKGTLNMEQDGWYIDLDVDFECITNQPPPQRGMSQPSGCQDRIVYRNSGAAKLGYALEETTRYYAPDGKTVQNESTVKVTELSRSTLDPALFDIPAGYQQASNQSELMDQQAMARMMMEAAREGGGSEGAASNAAETGGAVSGGVSAPAVTGGATGPKQPGTIRVGVVRIGNKTTQSVDAGTMRAALIASLSGSGVEAIPLNESAPDAAQAEAKQKECDFVLFTDISGLKQSTANKIGGMFGRATGVGAAADRFEAKVDYTLTPVAGGAPTQSSATAKEDGGADASVNSALRKEAQAVLARVRK